MPPSENFARNEWDYFVEFLRREMKPVFIFVPLMLSIIANVAIMIFMFFESIALTSSATSMYIAAILFTTILGLLTLVQFTAEFLTSHVGSQPVYDDASIPNTVDVRSYRGTALFQFALVTLLLWLDVWYQEAHCGTDSDFCLTDKYIDLHRILMNIGTIITINNLIFMSQNWYGYVRPNYDSLILARNVYRQYMLDAEYSSSSVTTIVPINPMRRHQVVLKK